ncbi:MAG: hypothetical protein STSR0008_25060 [Ignavibacterium sp.]
MSKVIFTVEYEIPEQNKKEYLNSIQELKSLIKYDGLLDYSIYEVKGKQSNKNSLYQEIFIFNSKESYDNYDDPEDERITLLINKIENLKVNNSTKYHTLFEIV